MAKFISAEGVWDNGNTLVRIMTGFFIFRYGRELFHIKDLLDFLTQSNFPFPVFSGYAAKIIELVGGILLILGFLTRWITPLLIIVMAGVIYTTAKGDIFQGELAFLYILLFAGFFFRGPGKWSLDHWLEARSLRLKDKP